MDNTHKYAVEDGGNFVFYTDDYKEAVRYRDELRAEYIYKPEIEVVRLSTSDDGAEIHEYM